MGRATFTYAVGGFAYKALALVSVPIFARVLAPAELGLLDLAALIAAVIGIAAALGVEQGVAYFEHRNELHDVWEAATALVVVVAGLAVVLAVVFQEPAAALLTGNSANSGIVVAAVAYGGVIGLTSLALIAIRLRAKPRTYAVISFLTVTLEMVVALFAAAVLAAPVAVIIMGWAIGALVVIVPSSLRYVPRQRSPRLTTVRRLIAFGAPLAPAAMAWLVGDAVIRSVLAHEADLSALGQYAIAQRLASVIALVVGGFAVAWYPHIYRVRQVVPQARRILPAVIGVCTLLAVAISAISPELLDLIAGPPYAAAYRAVPLLCAGMICLSGFVVLSGVSNASGRTQPVALAALGGLATQTVFAFILVPPIGLIGAAASSLAGYAVAVGVLVVRHLAVIIGRTGLVIGIVALAGSFGLVVADQMAAHTSLLVRGLSVLGFVCLFLLLAFGSRQPNGRRADV